LSLNKLSTQRVARLAKSAKKQLLTAIKAAEKLQSQTQKVSKIASHIKSVLIDFVERLVYISVLKMKDSSDRKSVV